MSDLSVSRENQRSLEDLKQDQDQKLRETRSEYKKKIEDTREAGDAAVNHIKRSTDERMDQVRTEGGERIKSETEGQRKTYTDLKRRAGAQNEQIQSRVEDVRQEGSKNIEAARSSEARAINTTQKSLRDFLEKQNELKHEARVETNENIDATRKQGAEKMHDERDNSEHQLSSYRKESKENFDRLKTHDQDAYAEEKSNDDRRLKMLKTTGDRQVTDEQTEKSKRLNDITHRYQDASKQEEERGETKLHTVQKEEERKFAQIRDHGTRVNEQTREEYAIESKRIQDEGKGDLIYQKEKYEDQKKTQAATQQAKLKQQSEQGAQDDVKKHQELRARSQAEVNAYESSMEHQRSEFTKRYENANQANHDSLSMQKENYMGALYKEKRKYESQLDGVRSRSSDDFYRLKTFSPNLEDRPDSYVLKARIAPYEKDNVEIIVRDNHITLTAKRSFQDDIKDGNERTTTNAYQTFRQEFKLDYPIDVARTIRLIDDNGNITVMAPKKGSGDGLVWKDDSFQRSEQGLGRV